jgi:DNA polymerase III epsilon subunit-like protein
MFYGFLDVETGGLNCHKNPTLQVSLVVTDEKFKIVEEYTSLINPPKNLLVEKEAIAINKISLSDLEAAPTEVEVITKLNQIITRYTDLVLIGYNVCFDISFIKSLCFRNLLHLECDGSIVDLHMSVRAITGIYKYSLKSTAEVLGIDISRFPSKFRDCYAGIEIAKKTLLCEANAATA